MENKKNNKKRGVAFFTLRLQSKSIRNKCNDRAIYEKRI